MDEKKTGAAPPDTPADKPDAGEFHYHYSARRESGLSQGSRQMMDLTGKVFLSGAIAMGGIFLGSFLLIGVLLLGSFTVCLAGGTIFCLGTACYLLMSGIGMLAASAFAGIGVVGFGLMMLSVTLLFGFATLYWVRKMVPGCYRGYRKFRAMLENREVEKA